MPNPFYQQDIISAKSFSREGFELVFRTTDKILGMKEAQRRSLAEGRRMGLMFFEPSTRTRLSFEAAILELGGSAMGFSEPQTSAVAKGESLADTVRVIESYVDIMVLRHPMEGAARFAAEVASKPLINAGSGTEEHPTQAMLDLYTLKREKGRIDGLAIAIMGDLKYGRTVYSLLYALSKFNTKIHLVSPPELRLRREAMFEIEGSVKIEQHSKPEEIIADVDVLYVTRIQKERFPDPHEYERVKGSYIIDRELLKKGKEDLIVLHPLPRVDEIRPEVDDTKHARYFTQANLGVPVRSALVYLILNPESL